MKYLVSAAVIAAASVSFVVVAQAEDIPATPMNHGPMMMMGMPVPAVNVVAPFDAVMGKPAPAAEPAMAPMKHKHHMHKKMMKKM